jgi:hypothetical protein
MDADGGSMSTDAAAAFAKNRAEELGFDLWGQFVVPLYMDKLALGEVRKPIVIEGGRGCGKTALLRYLSSGTQLSPRRALHSDTDVPNQIGLYLRADTQFLRALRGDPLSLDDWRRVFEHWLALTVLTELFQALRLLAAAERGTRFIDVTRLDLSVLRDFAGGNVGTLADAEQHLAQQRRRLAVWLNNIDDASRPLLLPFKAAVLATIDAVRRQCPVLADRVFFVFVDEYENLLDDQMRFINTLMKHSEPPLIVHVATKLNGMATRATLGAEQLQEPADLRTFDVEHHLEAEGFALFAAELFCFRLADKGVDIGPNPVRREELCTLGGLSRRRSDAYRAEVLATVRRILPGLSHERIAKHILEDAALRRRLTDRIGAALPGGSQGWNAADFVRDTAARASVCVPALLNQGKAPGDLLTELERCAAGQPSRFEKSDWIHHFFLGSVLFLYLSLQRPCPIYAGFDTFVRLSRCNTRHFLELCHLSLLKSPTTSANWSVPIEEQAAAARAASALFVKETQGSGDEGNRLHLVVHALGQIFRFSQARPSQSEPERTHFSITDGQPSPPAARILSECVKWSVLSVEQETKVKDARFSTHEYVLNPVFAPYFGISYNKGRRLELTSAAANQLLTGDRDAIDALIRHFRSTWLTAQSEQLALL